MSSTCCQNKQKKMSGNLDSLVLYKPLIVIVTVALFLSASLAFQGSISFMSAMMGIFLALLACLKFFNIRGFADSFSKYDIVAGRYYFYGVIYPFIEILLAGLYLSALWPVFTNGLMMVVMIVSTIGVVKIIMSGKSVQCACVGSSFNLPIGKVTFFENMVMMLMAAFNLVFMM